MLDCKKNADRINVDVPSNDGRHDPSDSGVKIETDVQLDSGGISCEL